MPYKRKRSFYVQRGRAALLRHRLTPMGGTIWGAKRRRIAASRGRAVIQRVNNLYRMIETKESRPVSVVNLALAHNNVTVLSGNPLSTTNGTDDVMAGVGQRVGDRISIRGMKACFFVEGALQRSKVYFRLMLIKMAKGDTLTRGTLFTGIAANKMIDLVNTERFTIVAQKIITVTPPSTAPSGVDAAGIGTIVSNNNITTGNRIVKFWIPGNKFGKNGNIVYENGASQVKFFDYKWCIVAYDWYGTPQDVNNVGIVNEAYSRLYYKDA